MKNSYSYIPGQQIDHTYPLARYLPPIPRGVASKWLLNNIPRGGIILDPFGSSPQLVAEIAEAGYAVIVAANNPISRFLIELAAEQPDTLQLKSALAELSSAPKGNERLEPFIRSLYDSECPQCGRTIEVEAFLWEKESAAPYGKIINCSYCGEKGEHPASQHDIEMAVRYSSSTLHYARALERIAPPRHPDRIHAEEAISVYLPRALYGLFTIINKIDVLDIPNDQKKLIDTLLLTAFDRSNNLWGYPTSRERPKSLVIPNRFRENNLWTALENSIDIWTKNPTITNLHYSSWPSDSTKPNTIYLYNGRLKNLVESLRNQEIHAVVTALPRPNQAFWSLSVLWSGWIWGSEVLGEFISAIRRRRYDWNWHTTALYSANKYLANILKDNTPVFGMIGEAEIGFISSALIAANNAEFCLTGIAPRFESGQAQLFWRFSSKKPVLFSSSEIHDIALSSGISYLKNRGEPANYLQMHTSSLTGIYKDRVVKHPSTIDQGGTKPGQRLTDSLSTSPSQDYSNIQTVLRRTLGNPTKYRRFRESESTESGFWGLLDESEYETPLSDRVEKLIVELLVKKPKCTLEEIDRACCREFPGLYTPSLDLLHICVESYAVHLIQHDKSWQLREEDIPTRRQRDIKNIIHQLMQLGEKFGFIVRTKASSTNKNTIIWMTDKEHEAYSFFPIASAIIGDIILYSELQTPNPIIVLPGGRANLVAFKIQRDPRLARKIGPDSTSNVNWRFLKFRHLRWLSENPLLSGENFDEQLNLDPLTYTTPQLRLL